MKDIKGAVDHLKKHQEYPATKDDLIAACYGLTDFSEEDKKWFMSHLPERTYYSADEVAMVLGW